jgi:hypothetical protein
MSQIMAANFAKLPEPLRRSPPISEAGTGSQPLVAMGAVGVTALIANGVSFAQLWAHRQGDAC